MNRDCRTALSHRAETPLSQPLIGGGGGSDGPTTSAQHQALTESATPKETRESLSKPEAVSHQSAPIAGEKVSLKKNENFGASPHRIQRQRTKGWRMPENTVSVTRPGPYGNPYTIKCAREADFRGTDAELAQFCVDQFRYDWEATLRSADTHPRHPPMPFGKPVYLGPLKGKNLACWCRLDQPCHADVLLDIANRA